MPEDLRGIAPKARMSNMIQSMNDLKLLTDTQLDNVFIKGTQRSDRSYW